jgi:hypothetical protein
MKIASYIWTVLIGIIEIIVALSILDGGYYTESFETRVLALLIIIYVSIRSLGMGLGQSIIRLSLTLDEESKKNKKFNPGTTIEMDEEIEREDKELLDKTLKEIKIKSIINGIVITLLYLISVITILGTL